MTELSFSQRFGFINKPLITNEFSESAKNALFSLLVDLVSRKYISFIQYNCWYSIYIEITRTNRTDYIEMDQTLYQIECKELISKMLWYRVFIFCERIYKKLLTPVYEIDRDGNKDVITTIEEVKKYFSDEINTIISEENIAYKFENGIFVKLGRAQTQKNIIRVGNVLNDINMQRVKTHYLKALTFFNKFPEPENENCVKEAICALESAAEILMKRNVTKDFCKEIQRFEGNEEGKIPSPIIQSIIKVYGYRNNGIGVAHGNTKGLKVTLTEAELILNLVASYITYLYDTLMKCEEAPPF